MTKTEAQKQVRAFCRSHGIKINASQGIPLLGKGDWFRCCDDWIDAYEWMKAAQLRYWDARAAYPWAA